MCRPPRSPLEVQVRGLLLASLLIPSALAITEAASAEPTIRLSWDQCDPIVYRKVSAGPGIHKMVLSAADLPSPIVAYWVELLVIPADGAPFPDAWRFDDNGCYGQHLVVNPKGNGGVPCLTMTTPNPILWAEVRFGPPDAPPNALLIKLINQFDNSFPDPTKRYTIATLALDQTSSVEGPGVPGSSCGNAATPVCVLFSRADLLPSSGNTQQMTYETPGVYWQNATGHGEVCSVWKRLWTYGPWVKMAPVTPKFFGSGK